MAPGFVEEYCFRKFPQTSSACRCYSSNIKMKESVEQCRNDAHSLKLIIGENPLPWLLSPPRTSQGLAWGRSQENWLFKSQHQTDVGGARMQRIEATSLFR